MKLVSLNVGQPRAVETLRGDVITSIYKEPVQGRRKVFPHNVEGDRQSDLSVHGGPRKAVYAYAWEHYSFWMQDLQESSLAAGMFGENLTVSGLAEAAVHVGDVVQIGSARLCVTEPRMPCFKLALRFGRSDIVKRFWQSGRSGVYFAVDQPGDMGSGDEVQVVSGHPSMVSIADVLSLYQGTTQDRDLFDRAMASPLTGGWRKGIIERWTGMN